MDEVKRYDVYDFPYGGHQMVPGDDWVRSEDYDALLKRNKDLETTVSRLLLLHEHGGRVVLREIPNGD